jgi:glycerol dehydrogenase
MENYSIYLPSYSIGEDVYSKIPAICAAYGKRIVAVGGERAIASVRSLLIKAVCDSELRFEDFIWFGGEASYENVEALMANPKVQSADMLFAIGGGKATDTTKCLAEKLHKPVFTVPTIASNCSACTSVSIMYHPDGSFREPFFFAKPPVHAFIQTSVIVGTPVQYMWAGIGDTYAKYFESTVSSRGEDLVHYTALGVGMSHRCYEPLMQYGRQALEDQKAGKVSYAFEQTVLAIIVTTAIVSILVTTEHIIDYNTGLAHAIYYALTSFPHIEEGHLHGELVGFGVLLLLLIDGQQEAFERVYAFNRSVGLPTSIADVEITEADLPDVIRKTVSMKDIDHNPYVITEEMVTEAFEKLAAFGKTYGETRVFR